MEPISSGTVMASASSRTMTEQIISEIYSFVRIIDKWTWTMQTVVKLNSVVKAVTAVF